MTLVVQRLCKDGKQVETGKEKYQDAKKKKLICLSTGENVKQKGKDL